MCHARGRAARGSRLISLQEGDGVASLARISAADLRRAVAENNLASEVNVSTS